MVEPCSFSDLYQMHDFLSKFLNLFCWRSSTSAHGPGQPVLGGPVWTGCWSGCLHRSLHTSTIVILWKITSGEQSQAEVFENWRCERLPCLIKCTQMEMTWKPGCLKLSVDAVGSFWQCQIPGGGQVSAAGVDFRDVESLCLLLWSKDRYWHKSLEPRLLKAFFVYVGKLFWMYFFNVKSCSGWWKRLLN